MKDRDVLRANERYRSISRTLFQLGGALLAATVVKAYTTGAIGLETLGWSLTTGMLIWLGWKVLDLSIRRTSE